MIQEKSGILLLDKPQGLSSAQCVNRLKKIKGVKKIGHAGALDPLATGLLICAINQATRLSRFFLNQSKTYTAVMRLGIETDTQDATGRIVDTRPVAGVTRDAVEAACRRFEGDVLQTPPVYSALKYQGRPLYEYARSGAPVEKPPRKITISHIRVLSLEPPDIRFEAACSSGTYIRTLCADLGRALGCGGHLRDLRRTECGGYHVENAMPIEAAVGHKTLEGLGDRLISPAEALTGMGAVTADKALADGIRQGRALMSRELPTVAWPKSRALSNFVKIMDGEGRLLAVVSPDETGLRYNYCCVFCNP